VNFASKYIAVGTSGKIISSTDATTWADVTSPTTNTLNGITSFFTTSTTTGVAVVTGNYIAVGNAGTVLKSVDAATWAAQTSGTTANLNAVATNYSTLFVAVGTDGTIVTSTDGITWTAATSSGTTRDLYAVTYSGGVWLAAGANGTLVKSTDGLTWTAVATGTTADLHGIAYGASTNAAFEPAYVLVGNGGTVLTSADLATATTPTWKVLTTAPAGAGNLNAVVYGSQFVTVGNGGRIYISTDGLAWTAVAPAGLSGDLLALARGSLMYAALGTAGTNAISR
jgi:hypothetical protein